MTRRLFCILASPFVLMHALKLSAGHLEYSGIQEYETTLFDAARQRQIPVAVYSPQDEGGCGVVIFSHGYGVNKGGDFKKYSHITRRLAQAGYFVISVQHELPTDDLLSMKGDLFKTRLPNWERGVENILFVMGEFKKSKPNTDWKNVSLMGHSNGGDMSMLFAQKHPEMIARAISLDNRRMPLPRMKAPKIRTLRGCDYPADEGVLPSDEDQKEFGIKVAFLKNIKHSEMDDKASEEQSEAINGLLLKFLRD